MAEAIGAGANVLAFILLGLKSVQCASETFSIIKDGPEIVQQLATDVRQLQSILTWVLQSQAAANDQALLLQAQQCIQEIQSLAASLQTLRLSPNDKFTGKCWKRLKAIMKENDLDRVSRQVNQHASLLNARIAALSRYDHLAVQSGFDQQATHLGQLNEKNIQRSLHEFEEMFRAQESARASDSSYIRTTLQTVMDHITASTPYNPSNSLQGELPDTRNQEAELPLADQQILQTLCSLSRLIDEKAREVDAYAEEDDLVASVVDDVQRLLQSIRHQKTPVDRQCNTISPGQELRPLSFESGLRRLGSGFLNGAVAINQRVNRQVEYEPRTLIQQIRTVDQKDVGSGRASLVISKRCQVRAGEPNDDQNDRKRMRTDYSISLTVLPNKSQDSHMIVASLSQHQVSFDRITSISTLMVNRVLPNESRVFQVVREGNLQELERMFRDKAASPRDHDEYGASLLMYATEQPQVCKFLIACGLDVDHVASGSGVHYLGDPACPLQLHIFDNMLPHERMGRINQCRKMLLQAGADPTLKLNSLEYPPSLLEIISADGIAESVRIMWNRELTGPFADINTTRVNGLSPFLMACKSEAFTKEFFQAFLSMGAKIDDRSSINGETCLHICIQTLGKAERWAETFTCNEFDAIEYLIEEGADPFAKDNNGMSVAQYAYSHGTEDIGSYLGDLWDAVVKSCGYKISQFRSENCRRIAKYTEAYPRAEFVVIWEQTDAVCPYWDDKPWPPIAPRQQGNEDDGYSEMGGDEEVSDSLAISWDNESGGVRLS
ncbi:ankyrin repeat-containing domain protein [Dactylonectria macrodidyma]|uniref:Ankyrin repeat-containing domain protein n=1 Tax=Dactylonectria macrodidyma TaxID=307937 RepID=A0A9P9IZI9_9HYPO|nr:ankyrin repeat-containing domain protein [Dactylonectria macrodidyma]